MKRLKYNINNILWLCKPYWKYDRAYFILYILTSFAFFPFGDIIYIYLPERVGHKKRRMPSAFSFLFQQVCLIAAGEAQDTQQADEDVVQRHVQAHGRADIVCLTAVNDVAGFIQDGAR